MRRAGSGALAFIAGFAVIVLCGKGIGGARLPFMLAVVPNGIFLHGLVLGMLSGMLAVGLVLVYRTNRIINFAQGELGAFAATLAGELVQRFRVPFYVSVLAGLVAAVLASIAVEALVIRRFARAPRLILTVVTIGVAQILGAIEIIIPYLFNRDTKLKTGFNTPLSFHFTYGHFRFSGDYLVAMIVTPIVVAGLVWFFRSTGYGLASRAAADNSDRARLLGVRVKRVSMVVWALAGFLSALTALLDAPISGFQLGAIGGFTLLMRALAAGVIARMESLPIAFGAAILISVGQQTLFAGTRHAGPDSGLLLVVVIVALFLQRKRVGRLESSESSWQAVQEVRPVPAELRALPEVRWARLGAGLILLVVLSVFPLVAQVREISLLSSVMLYAMVGVSLVMLTGWSGNVSLGQWAIVGVGGLLAGKLATQAVPQDFFVTLLVAGLAGAATALVLGLPALRIRGLFLGVTTLAFAVAASGWLFQSFAVFKPVGVIRRPVLFGLLDVTPERRYYFVCLAGLVLALIVARNLRRGRVGRVLIAMRENDKHAQALGVPFVRTKLAAFAASGFLAALAGALYAYHQQFLPTNRFPAETSLIIFSMVVIGGMGSLSGAILGAMYVYGTQYFLPAQFQLLVTGLGVLLLLLFFPGGLGQIVYSLRDSYLRWVANRRGILVPSLVADRRAPDVALAQIETIEPPDAVVAEAAATAEALAGAGGTGT